jgi:cation diffusion facilitator family transporter
MQPSSLKVRTALLSVLSNSALLLLKLLVGLVTRSVSVLAEAAHTAIDLGAALTAWMAVGRADSPADARHPYGHGKFESLAAFAEAALLLVTSAMIIWAASHRLVFHLHDRMQVPALGALMMALSTVTNVAVSGRLFRVAHATESVALEGDAWHLRTDAWTGAAAFCALAAASIGRAAGFPLDILDPIAAIVVAVIMASVGVIIIRRVLLHLADASLPAEEVSRVGGLLAEHYPQLLEFHRLRTRRAGSQRLVDLHIMLPPTTTVQEAHDLCDHLERDIRAALPGTDVTIHVEPAPAAPESSQPGDAQAPMDGRKGSGV